jgi:DNA-binding NtrC family response regulator
MPMKAERRLRGHGEAKRVLVVDDEADIRELLDLTLARMGLSADCVGSLGEARRMLAGQRYQLCLTDMRLPDGEGLDLVRHIAETVADLPVAVITAPRQYRECGVRTQGRRFRLHRKAGVARTVARHRQVRSGFAQSGFAR